MLDSICDISVFSIPQNDKSKSQFMGHPTLRRAIEVAQVVALRDGASVRELGEILRLPRSTAHRLVAALAEIGLIKRGDRAGRYVLGNLIGEVADGPLYRRILLAHCRPAMDALRDTTGETVGLHVLNAGRRVLIDQSESMQEHRWVYSNPLVPMPAHAGAAAKMLLALIAEDDASNLLRREPRRAFTRRTPRNPDLLIEELRKIRMKRYALSMEEVTEGISSIAAPVIEEPIGPLPIAVLSVTGPSVRLSERVLKSFLPPLRAATVRAAQKIEQSVGRPPQAA